MSLSLALELRDGARALYFFSSLSVLNFCAVLIFAFLIVRERTGDETRRDERRAVTLGFGRRVVTADDDIAQHCDESAVKYFSANV